MLKALFTKNKKRQGGRSQIIATIGPASSSIETLEKMIDAGMDIARLNFSWGTHDEHRALISNIRAAATKKGVHIPIIQDLSGPRVQHSQGHAFNEHFSESKHAHGVLTEKDLRDLDFGASQNIEYVALSYVGSANDVAHLRAQMKIRDYNARIIAKIERADALKHIKSIISASDAVMVARGDLGNEVPLEQIPYIQLDIIRTANRKRRPAITATQMMLSMKENPLPTRAEVTDVAYAILDGSDAVMLSEESAQGKYPSETIAMMDRIIVEAERHEYKPKLNLL
ncbi:MAG: hypothetical protein RIT04_197 [Candidatus Parcubacteria bacterium]|jgi:pyruvate kinase